MKIKQNTKNAKYKLFHQKMFDLIFNKIEQNMREIGYSDTTVNKNMRFFVKTFYSILLNCEKYKKKSEDSKNKFLNDYLEVNNVTNNAVNRGITEYFNKYEAFCFDLDADSVLQGELKFTYK